MYDEHTQSASHSLTLFNFSGTLQAASSIELTFYLASVTLKSVPGTIRAKNNNSTRIAPGDASESCSFVSDYGLVCIHQ